MRVWGRAVAAMVLEGELWAVGFKSGVLVWIVRWANLLLDRYERARCDQRTGRSIYLKILNYTQSDLSLKPEFVNFMADTRHQTQYTLCSLFALVALHTTCNTRHSMIMECLSVYTIHPTSQVSHLKTPA